MRAFALSDGAAGNAKQALALASLMGLAATPITLQLNGIDRWLAPRLKAASLKGTTIGESSSLATLASWLDSAQPELVIGCGRSGAAALRTIKQAKSSCKTVQILAPECSVEYFDWVICPEHDRLRGPNVLTSLGAIHTIESQLSVSSNQSGALLLLLGQANTNARWTQDQLRTLLADMRQWPGQIYISTSRRSGFNIDALIAASPLAGHAGVEIYQAGSAAANPYMRWLLSASQIIVTPDSVNMVSEAMATRAQVCVPWQASAQGKIARFLQANRARISRLDASCFSGARTQAVPHADCEALAQVLRQQLRLS